MSADKRSCPILSRRFTTRFDSAVTRSILYQEFYNRLGRTDSVSLSHRWQELWQGN